MKAFGLKSYRNNIKLSIKHSLNHGRQFHRLRWCTLRQVLMCDRRVTCRVRASRSPAYLGMSTQARQSTTLGSPAAAESHNGGAEEAPRERKRMRTSLGPMNKTIEKQGRGNKGKLSKLPDMPMDVLYEVGKRRVSNSLLIVTLADLWLSPTLGSRASCQNHAVVTERSHESLGKISLDEVV